MNALENKNVHEKDPELVVAFIKGVISTIPVVGGILAEVGNVWFNPLEKRKQEWISQISSAIQELENRFNGITQTLQDDDVFISFLYQTTSIALKNHRKEKIEALRNSVMHVALKKQINEDVIFQFLNYLDSLTVTHIVILREISNKIKIIGTFDNILDIYLEVSKSLDVSLEKAIFRSFLSDLDTRFLIRIGDVEDFQEFASKKILRAVLESSIRYLEVTSLGVSFLEFINTPIDS